MNNQPHRDIFSGMVAAELSKNGYFGEELNYYSYLFWNNEEIHIVSYESETLCIKNMLDQLDSGIYISNYVHFKKRIYEEEGLSKEQIKQEAQQRAKNTLLYKFTQSIFDHQNKKENLREKEIEAFFEANPEFNSEVRTSFLGKALREKWISSIFYTKYSTKKHSKEMEGNYSDRKLYGFAWFDKEIKIYCNLYLPTVWEKYLTIQKENYKISSIVSQKCDAIGGNLLQEEKFKFKEYLKTIFKHNYFSFMTELEK